MDKTSQSYANCYRDYGIKKNELKPTTATIVTIFKKHGARAGIKNMLFVFNVPIVRAARLIKSKNGNIILVSNTVNWNFSSLAVNPGAISFTIKGLNKIPKRVIIPTTITIKVKRLFTICFVSSGFFYLRFL